MYGPRHLCYTYRRYRAKHITYLRNTCSWGLLTFVYVVGEMTLLWIWNCLRDNNYVLQFYRIRLCGRLGLSNLGISGNKSTGKSYFQDQEKQQISFFVKNFPVKNSDRLDATAARKVLDVRVLGSVRPSLRLCKILVQFVTFRLFSGPFYITGGSSVYFLTIFKLIKNLKHQSLLFCLIFWSRIQRAHTKPCTGL